MAASPRVPTHAPPTHPGEMLLEEFLIPAAVAPAAFAERAGISGRYLDGLIRGEERVTSRVALQLGRATKMGADFWLSLQRNFDLYQETRRAPPP